MGDSNEVPGGWEFAGHSFPRGVLIHLRYEGRGQKKVLIKKAQEQGAEIINRVMVFDLLRDKDRISCAATFGWIAGENEMLQTMPETSLTAEKIGEIALEMGFSKILVVTDGGFSKVPGFEKVIDRISDAGIEYRVFSNLKGEPDMAIAEEGMGIFINIFIFNTLITISGFYNQP